MGGRGRPIETLYRGYRFRSRLEAKWAVFFDAAGIEWHYEDHGGWDLSYEAFYLDLDDVLRSIRKTIWYLPDFYLPQQDYWVEIKGFEPTTNEGEKMWRLADATGKEGYIFWGKIPDPVAEKPRIPAYHYEPRYPSAWGYIPIEGDNGHGFKVDRMEYPCKWCECPVCGLLGISPYGAAEGLPCSCFTYNWGWEMGLSVEPPRTFTPDTPRLVAAYDAARQARFEHHEVPVTKTAPLRKALHQERLRAAAYKSKLERIRELLDSNEP